MVRAGRSSSITPGPRRYWIEQMQVRSVAKRRGRRPRRPQTSTYHDAQCAASVNSMRTTAAPNKVNCSVEIIGQAATSIPVALHRHDDLPRGRHRGTMAL